MRKLRTERGWSAQRLSEEMSKVGVPWDRSIVANLEYGRRRTVSVEELLALAYVLAVPPPLLFLDLESGADVEIVAGVALHPWLVWEWATGERPPLVRVPEGGTLITRVEEFARSKTVIHLYRWQGRAAIAVHDADSAVRSAEYVGDADQLRAARAAQVDALHELAKVLDQMIEHNITPPGTRARWVEAIRSLGLSEHPGGLVVDGSDDGR
jgi:transcriptional regulator with XRE-family HTH domain